MLPRYARYSTSLKVEPSIVAQACFPEAPSSDSRVEEGTKHKGPKRHTGCSLRLLEGATQHFCFHFTGCNFVSTQHKEGWEMGVIIYSGPKPAKY